MKTVAMLFSDKWMTNFMQHADVFESFKVVVKPFVEANVADTWGEKEVNKVLALCKEPECNYKPIAIVGDEIVYYKDATIKVISSGDKWCLLDDYLNAIMKGLKPDWSVGALT